MNAAWWISWIDEKDPSRAGRTRSEGRLLKMTLDGTSPTNPLSYPHVRTVNNFPPRTEDILLFSRNHHTDHEFDD
jgi:hypothetical protein